MSPRTTAHVNTVYFVWNQEFDVFWLSDPAATHSRNIRARRSTAIAVYDSRQVWGGPTAAFNSSEQHANSQRTRRRMPRPYMPPASRATRRITRCLPLLPISHRPTKGVRRVRVRGGGLRHGDYPHRTAPDLGTNGHLKRSRHDVDRPLPASHPSRRANQYAAQLLDGLIHRELLLSGAMREEERGPLLGMNSFLAHVEVQRLPASLV